MELNFSSGLSSAIRDFTTFCYLGNDRVVVGRGVLVNRITVHRNNAGSVLCGAFGERSNVIPSAAAAAATFAHLQYYIAHCAELFPFRGCKVAVGVGDVDVISICACTTIGSATPGGATTSLA